MGFERIEAQWADPTQEAIGNPQVKLIALYVKTGKSFVLATRTPLTDLSSSFLSSFTSCESKWFPDTSLFAQKN
jgi:hypothetical protein